MRLFKILNAIDRGASVVQHEKLIANSALHLERYAYSALNTKTLLHDIHVREGVAHIGGERVDVVGHNLKKGNLEFIRKVYKIADVPRPLALRAAEDVKELASAKIGALERNAETFKSRVREKVPERVFGELNTPGTYLTEGHVRDNKVLQDILKEMQSKNLKPITGTALLLSGLSTAILVSTINKRMDEIKGCTAYMLQDGQMYSCKIATCSCDGKGRFNATCSKHCVICPPEITASLPDVMTKNPNACVGQEGPCVNCPSDELDKRNAADITNLMADFATISQTDKLHIKCNDPGVWDTIVDIFGDLGANLLDVVDSAAKGASWVFSHMKQIFIYGGIAAFVVAVIAVFLRFRMTSSVPQTAVLV